MISDCYYFMFWVFSWVSIVGFKLLEWLPHVHSLVKQPFVRRLHWLKRGSVVSELKLIYDWSQAHASVLLVFIDIFNLKSFELVISFALRGSCFLIDLLVKSVDELFIHLGVFIWVYICVKHTRILFWRGNFLVQLFIETLGSQDLILVFLNGLQRSLLFTLTHFWIINHCYLESIK